MKALEETKYKLRITETDGREYVYCHVFSTHAFADGFAKSWIKRKDCEKVEIFRSAWTRVKTYGGGDEN